jgi:hypothetical protein
MEDSPPKTQKYADTDPRLEWGSKSWSYCLSDPRHYLSLINTLKQKMERDKDMRNGWREMRDTALNEGKIRRQ